MEHEATNPFPDNQDILKHQLPSSKTSDYSYSSQSTLYDHSVNTRDTRDYTSVTNLSSVQETSTVNDLFEKKVYFC